MKSKCFLGLILILAMSILTFGQDTDDFEEKEYKKHEVYIGYNGKVFDDVIDYEFQNGFQTSYVRNFDRYIGVKGDFSLTHKRQTTVRNNLGEVPNNFSVSTRNVRTVTTLMGGVEIKDNKSKKAVVPFGHALAGVGWLDDRNRQSCVSGNCPTSFLRDTERTNAGFATSYGGGVDVKITKNLTFRPQADYSYIKLDGINRHNLRFGAGLVFKWN